LVASQYGKMDNLVFVNILNIKINKRLITYKARKNTLYQNNFSSYEEN